MSHVDWAYAFALEWELIGTMAVRPWDEQRQSFMAMYSAAFYAMQEKV